MRGERERKKKADNLDREHEEQHSQGQWNSGEMMACLPSAAALLSAYPIAPISPGRDINRLGDYCARGRNNFSSRGYSGPRRRNSINFSPSPVTTRSPNNLYPILNLRRRL